MSFVAVGNTNKTFQSPFFYCQADTRDLTDGFLCNRANNYMWMTCLFFIFHLFILWYCKSAALHWVAILTTHESERERERERERHGGGRIVTTAGALVCHLCLRQIIREIEGGGVRKKKKPRNAGVEAAGQEGGGFSWSSAERWCVSVQLRAKR